MVTNNSSDIDRRFAVNAHIPKKWNPTDITDREILPGKLEA